MKARDGQLGGGWGDDVEVWRDWVSVLLGYRDPQLEECWIRLAGGVLARPSMVAGYTDQLTDVEHSAELTGDPLTSLLLLRPTNTSLQDWAAATLPDLARDLWMGTNNQGRQQFRSTYLTSRGAVDNVLVSCDTAYHSRVLQPSLLAWQRGDWRPAGLLLDWLESWLAAGRIEERGKPAGVLPSAVSWPSGQVGGWAASTWDDPGCHYSRATYRWPRGVQRSAAT